MTIHMLHLTENHGDIMTYIMPIYTTLVGLIIGFLVGRIKLLVTQAKETKKRNDDIYSALKEGMAILLRHELLEYYDKFEDKHSIPTTEWSDIEQTHKVYNSLGGNSTGDRIYELLKQKHLEK